MLIDIPTLNSPQNPRKGAIFLPDNVITWTTAVGLILFGLMFFDDPSIMGRTILVLGTIIAVNECLKAVARRSHTEGRFRRIRNTLAVLYLVLVLLGFIVPGIVTG